MNEDIEKIDSAKDSRSTANRERQKQKFNDDKLYATIDKTPYRGYGFTEVYGSCLFLRSGVSPIYCC